MVFARSKLYKIIFVILSVILASGSLLAQIHKFVPKEGEALEIWRITHDPTVRDWANYHNTQCWSHDGRYICYTHFASDGKEFGNRAAAEIHLYDLYNDKDIKIDNGSEPRWANNNNWLFYLHSVDNPSQDHERGSQVVWLDLENNVKKIIASGINRLRETDENDRWLYGLKTIEGGGRRGVRMLIMENSTIEILPGEGENQFSDKMTVNPKHPVIVYQDHNYEDFNFSTDTQRIPFPARHHVKCDLEGKNKTEPFPFMEGSHFSWSGDGTYFLLGNGILRGVRWDDFVPGNTHFLAPIRVGDVGKCGFSGRWVNGSTYNGTGPLAMADLRSGDGWIVYNPNSIVCFPSTEDNSGVYDIDAKGSPDATKIIFVSNYDLENGPYTELVENITGDVIKVLSTKDFPEKGRIVVVTGFAREVLGYDKKTATTFEKLTRGLYETPVSNPDSGQSITLFESRLIPEELWPALPLPGKRNLELFKDPNSPLLKQRSSNIYGAIVRLPDAPFLRLSNDTLELIPGENHWEISGYKLFIDGRELNNSLVKHGEIIKLKNPGNYTAVAVEWSGLESKPIFSFRVEKDLSLKVLSDKPEDFSWTKDRWLIDGTETSEQAALKSEEAVKEIVHWYDGVIHREWYSGGQIEKRFDYNLQGKVTRKLFYQSKKLSKRELYQRDGKHISTEYFDTNGYITEAFHNPLGTGSTYGYTHWWYEKGVPVKAIKKDEIYLKDGSQWIKK